MATPIYAPKKEKQNKNKPHLSLVGGIKNCNIMSEIE